ncbi:MAG: FlgD immunoglobulin-like domain containing protein [Candidatus Neomarinimicrobiota bacterium]|jgi:flagellar hook assembly protein FlgD
MKKTHAKILLVALTALQVYALPDIANIHLRIFDINGRKVKEWSISDQQAGWHKLTWDGRDMRGNILPSGVYIYSFGVIDSGQSFFETKKMLFLK